MGKNKHLIIVGIGETAEIAYEYFTYDSDYEVVGFSVNREFIKGTNFLGLPIYEFENLQRLKSPSNFDVYIAISYVKLNRTRAILYNEAKKKGFKCANYISSQAFVWRNVTLGDNVFIFENNVIQHQVKLGNDVILWSGNHIGHRTIVGDHVFVSSHCVIAGFCEIGEHSFIGINSTINNNVRVAKDNIIGSGALLLKDTQVAQVMTGSPAVASLRSSYETLKMSEAEIISSMNNQSDDIQTIRSTASSLKPG